MTPLRLLGLAAAALLLLLTYLLIESAAPDAARHQRILDTLRAAKFAHLLHARERTVPSRRWRRRRCWAGDGNADERHASSHRRSARRGGGRGRGIDRASRSAADPREWTREYPQPHCARASDHRDAACRE